MEWCHYLERILWRHRRRNCLVTKRWVTIWRRVVLHQIPQTWNLFTPGETAKPYEKYEKRMLSQNQLLWTKPFDATPFDANCLSPLSPTMHLRKSMQLLNFQYRFFLHLLMRPYLNACIICPKNSSKKHPMTHNSDISNPSNQSCLPHL